MKKAMIITVGTGPGVENGIAFSINQQNPEFICFIYSKDSERTIYAVLEKLGRKKDEVCLKRFDEVNDVEALYQEYGSYLEELFGFGYKPQEIVADYTSGTKSMSAALVSVAIAKEIGILSYVYGMRDEQGRVVSNTERLSPLSPNAIFTEQKLKLFKQLFNRYQYDGALTLLKDAMIHPNFKKQVGFYQSLANAYGEWDRFNFKKASEVLNEIGLEMAEEYGLRKIIEIHKVKLYKLKTAESEGKLCPEDLTDLYSNAARRYEEGKYDDGVSRLYRLMEMIAQIEFEREFQMTTGKVPFDFLPDSLQKRYEPQLESQTVEIGLLDSFHVLQAKSENSSAKAFFREFDTFRKLLQARNYSRLAHGQRAIGKENYEKFSLFVIQIFNFKEKTEFPKLV